MPRSDTLVFTSLLCTVGLWCAALLAAGLTAGVVFSQLGPLEPASPTMEGYPQPWQWRHIAGMATDPAFRIADIIQFVCFPVALGLLAWQYHRGTLQTRSWLDQVRTWSVLAAGGLVLIRWINAQMTMATLLDEERSAVTRHDWAAAEEAQRAFLEHHSTAAHLWEATAVVMLLAFVTTAWAASRHA